METVIVRGNSRAQKRELCAGQAGKPVLQNKSSPTAVGLLPNRSAKQTLYRVERESPKCISGEWRVVSGEKLPGGIRRTTRSGKYLRFAQNEVPGRDRKRREPGATKPKTAQLGKAAPQGQRARNPNP